MYCQQCKKQAATVHITEIEHGEKHEHHLCESCATETKTGIATPKMVPFGKTLAEFVMKNASAKELAKLTCPQCNTTFVEFRNSGLLGCPCDYDAFEKALVPLIERAHERSSHHVGKIPRRLGTPRPVENDLVHLRGELNKAVGLEQYEKAAALRDKIRILETGE